MKKFSEEHKKRISESLKGRTIPRTVRAKMSVAKGRRGNLGQHWTLSAQAKRNISLGHQGKKAYQWKGDKVGYSGLHQWVAKE